MVVGGTFIEPQDEISDFEAAGSPARTNKKLSLSSSQKPPNIIYLMTVLSAMGGFLFGYDTGIVGGAMVFVRKVFHLNNFWHQLIVGITITSAWMFSLEAGRACDSYGRKPVILVASVIFTAGSIIMGFAMTKTVLLIGRFTVGIAIGLASTAVPIYIAEVAPSNIRGSLVTLNNCFITFGQLSAAVTAGAFSYDRVNGWRWMLGLAAVPSVIQFVGFIFMPESPRWLLKRDRPEEALKALKRIRGDKNPYVLREFDKIRINTNELRAQEARRKEQNRNLWVTILRRTATRRALLVGCLIMAAQQLAGINTVMYYTPKIIQMSGIQSDSAAVWLAVPTATVFVIFCIFGCLIADRMNRRTLLLGSLMGVMMSLILLGAGFHMQSSDVAPVTDHNANETQVCFEKGDCSSCIENSRCGFCFNPNEPSKDTFCLEVEPGSGKHSREGNCKRGADNAPLKYVFALHLCPQVNESLSTSTWFVFAGLVLYLAFFAPGMSPMPWTINSEIYPMWARSACYSIATSINWLFNMVVTFTFISLTELITIHGVFYMFAIISGVCWIVLFFELPETRGRSLDDSERLFARRANSKKANSEELISNEQQDAQNQQSPQNQQAAQSQQLDFPQLGLISTQMSTGGHRHSIVLCHGDLAFAADEIAASKLEQQQAGAKRTLSPQANEPANEQQHNTSPQRELGAHEKPTSLSLMRQTHMPTDRTPNGRDLHSNISNGNNQILRRTKQTTDSTEKLAGEADQARE